MPAMLYNNEGIELGQPHELTFYIQCAAGSFSLLNKGSSQCILIDANGDSSQSAVNALLKYDSAGAELSSSSTSEVDYATSAHATAMGTDSFLLIVNMKQQVKELLGAHAILGGAASSAIVGEVFGASASQTNTLTNMLYKTPGGNIVCRAVVTGADASSDVIVLKIHAYMK